MLLLPLIRHAVAISIGWGGRACQLRPAAYFILAVNNSSRAVFNILNDSFVHRITMGQARASVGQHLFKCLFGVIRFYRGSRKRLRLSIRFHLLPTPVIIEPYQTPWVLRFLKIIIVIIKIGPVERRSGFVCDTGMFG